MNFWKRALWTGWLIVLLVTTATSAMGQTWSLQEQEVWGTVTTYWKVFCSGNLDGFMSFFHVDFSGWRDSSPLPDDKGSRYRWEAFDLRSIKPLNYEVKPCSIKVLDGKFAIVHYYFSLFYRNADGKASVSSGRWTDILMKEGNRWLIVGDHGHEDPVR